MRSILESLQKKMGEIPELKYVDENWGQIDYYSPNTPVQWPCCLIDIQSGNFSNIGKDLSKKPTARQMGQFSIKIIVANLKLSNTSFAAPLSQKNDAWLVFDLVEKIHEKLHGYSPVINCSKMLRSSFQRTLRDDGVQEYAIVYECEASNI
ncbi:MAG: hypothetical protein KBA33_09925 [Cloacibacterium sp.]|nr:hypothetical protein [Cloacibacterium sp.]